MSSDSDEILETIATVPFFKKLDYALQNFMHVVNLLQLGINNYR